MTIAERIAAFATRVGYDDLDEETRAQLKLRILDSLGCAIGALDGEPIRAVRAQLEDFGGSGRCTLIGGGRSSPDRAAFYNGALVRYLDFMDNYLAKGVSCHPSDTLGAVLAAAEYAERDGRDLLAALAVAYHVLCRLCDVAPVIDEGFDHTALEAIAVAAGVSRALGLDERRTANAIGICGAAYHALWVTRTGRISQWKGLAGPNVAFGCTHATFLAMRGVTGPLNVFEGPKGFEKVLPGDFEAIDWTRERPDRARRTSLKAFNGEVHGQSAIEGVLELRERYRFAPEEVERVDVEIFHEAYNIIGGGEGGDRAEVETKEQADHSLPYMVAVAILDGELTPAQYRPERIRAADVQALLRKVHVRPPSLVPGIAPRALDPFSWRYPEELPCRVTVHLAGGREIAVEKRDYEGFATRPMPWGRVVEKFEALSAPFADPGLRQAIVGAVASLETLPVAELTDLLARAGAASRPQAGPRA